MGRNNKHACFTETLDVLDIFSSPIHLTLHKKRIITSYLGGVLTIALVILIFYQTASQFVVMVDHKDPKLYQIEDLEDTPSALSLRESDHFILAILITVNSVIINITDDAPFNFPTYYIKQRTQEDGTVLQYSYPLLWAPCNQSDFPDEIYGEGTFSSVSLQLGYCAYGINYLNTTTRICPENILKGYSDCIIPLNFELQGDSSSDNYDYIQSNFKICDQSDMTLPYGVTCTSDNMTETFGVSSYEVSLYLSNTAINMLNYETPNRTFIEDIYWKLNPSISQVADIFVDKIIVEDSDSFWLSNENNRSYFQVDSDKVRETERYLTTSQSSKILQWNMKRSNTNLVVSRTYTKVTDILTDLGGFSKAAMFAAAFLAIGFVRYKYQITVANGLYDFEFDQGNERKNPQIKNDFSRTNFTLGVANGCSLFDASLGEGNNSNNKAIVDYFERLNRRGKLDESEWGYFKMVLNSICRRRDPRIKLSAKARDLTTKDLDVIKIARKLGEFEILISIILNTNQRKVFEFFENPLLTLNDQKTLNRIKRLRASATSLASTPSITSKDLHLPLSKINKTLPEAGGFPNEEIPSNLKQIKLRQGGRTMDRSKTITDDQQLVDYRRKSKRTISTMRNPKDEEDVFSSLSRYGKLYMAYRHLKEDENPLNKVINTKLVSSISPDLRKVFQRIDQLLGDEYTVEQFEEVVQNILEEPRCLVSIRQ